jgi:hypothetical protein
MKQPLLPYISQQTDQTDRAGLVTTLNFGVFFVGNHLDGLPQIHEKRYYLVNTIGYIWGGG